MSSPGRAVGIDLFQQDGLTSPRLPSGGQHLQHCPVVGAEEQDGGIAVGTSRAVHSYLGQQGPGQIGLRSGQPDWWELACFRDSPRVLVPPPGPSPQPSVPVLAPPAPARLHCPACFSRKAWGGGEGRSSPYLLVRVSSG